jgi:RHS repeat-associated protein
VRFPPVNVYAPAGLVARQQGGLYTYYSFDPLGNVALRTNSSQATISTSIYDSYGVEHSAGTTPTDMFGYQAQNGYLLDRESGLYLCQHRYYDAASGNWLTRDPLGYALSVNQYLYCVGNPVTGSDSQVTARFSTV